MLARLTRLLVWMALFTGLGVKAHDGLEAGRTLTAHIAGPFDIFQPVERAGRVWGWKRSA